MKRQDVAGFMIDGWRVSPPEGVLTRGDETAHLEPKAMEVLVYLASHPGEVITREELERNVWHGAVVGYDAVTNTIIKLRKALQDSARQPHYIATIPKKGYQLIASVTCSDDDNSPATVLRTSNEPVASAAQEQPAWYTHKKGMGITTLAAILVFGLVWLWPESPTQSKPATTVHKGDNLVLPSIIVLPFENLSDDPKQEYLADGITEDIITDLSRLSNLLVIASNTSFTYKGKQVTLEDVATDLNVVFVLKGSIRQLDDAVRVNAQLVNTTTGFNTWAQRYDRKISEVFTVQDEVTQSIVEALAIKMTSQEKQRLSQKTTNSLKAYDFFQEGQKIIRVNTKETNAQARAMYREAIELDPDYGRAYGAMAYTLAADFRRGWTDTPLWTLDRALELAKKAVALDDSTPQTYWALGFVYLNRKEYDHAEKAVEQAINIAPNYADGYGLLALINSFLGKPERAIELNNKAIRLNPYYTFEYLYIHGMAYYKLGDYDAAIAILEEAQERNANAIQVKVFLAASYVRSGRQDDAEWVINELQVLSPTATITGLDNAIPIAVPEFKHALLDDLRKAGLPE
jgi:TolB-like protein/DNA-binding winged helix-turn-helix (wHTH) protein/Flp pilus assembly protein TadD